MPALKYLDTTYNYSNPADTNLKYLKKVVDPDGTIRTEWAAPTDDAEFLDATGNYSVPELAPDLSGLTNWDDISWDVINEFGQKRVLKHPEKYESLTKTTKTVPQTSPVNKDIVYEIVDICHTDWGSDNAFVWMPQKQTIYDSYEQEIYKASYKDRTVRSYLLTNGTLYKTYPDDLKAVWKDISYKYLTTANGAQWMSAMGPLNTETAKLVIPAVVEMGYSLSSYPSTQYSKEGTVFRAFEGDVNSDRVRKTRTNDRTGWWLRSLCGGSVSGAVDNWDNCYVSTDGTLPGAATRSMGVVPCFAV